MKMFADDCEELSLRAAGIAWNPSPDEKFVLLTQLFKDCGTAAVVYKDPAAVAALLVSSAVKAYAEAFNTQMEATA